MSQKSTTKLPIVESFHSYQGEGQWTGTPMHFIRTAGCNVGQHPDTEEVKYEIGQDINFPILKTGYPASRCHTYDGRGFWCDTDFHRGVLTLIDELIADTWEHHICLTGGEPLLHRAIIMELVDRVAGDCLVHIETSGTVLWSFPHTWITVSPKQGYSPLMIEQADEIKLLIDPTFKLESVPSTILGHKNVYIQPVNGELHINSANLALCNDVLRQMPNWKLSVQLHKVFGWR